MAAAALPAAALSITSAIRSYSSTVELNKMNLVENAQGVARRVEDEISEAGKVARLLAALPGMRTENVACTTELKVVVENFAAVSAAALIRPDRSVACAAGIKSDERQALLIAAAMQGEQLTIDGAVGALSVPVEGREGWRLSVAQPLASPIEAAMDAFGQSVDVGVVDQDWTPIAGFSSPISAAETAPAGMAPSSLTDSLAVVSDNTGTRIRIAVAPILRSDLYAFAFRPHSDLLHQEIMILVGGIAAPLLIILFTVFAAWIGIDRLALRWIVYLRRITDAYGGGRSSVRAQGLSRAPAELAALGAAFDRMADAVGDRTKTAEEEARARGLLLRELHHRIKNNFQIVSSLVSLQKRETTPEIAAALSVHERRVGAIAAAYRVAYAEGEVGLVNLAALLRELREVIARHGERPWARIELRLEDNLPSLVLDRAVPAALLITKLADTRITSSPGQRATVTIFARVASGGVTIDIEGGNPDPLGAAGMSTRLRDAFALQLEASVDEVEDGSRTSIRFSLGKEEADAIAGRTKPFPRAEGLEPADITRLGRNTNCTTLN